MGGVSGGDDVTSFGAWGARPAPLSPAEHRRAAEALLVEAAAVRRASDRWDEQVFMAHGALVDAAQVHALLAALPPHSPADGEAGP